ncbi:hypothetical protein JTE90_026621 [Oedothorax gibbosus]|uniref:Uncharacterized protein n=1 Tax=Oedothorax gibbosus TaxID=931172 RepID=A0AAV6TJN2_9ARAC|nr:hypothetical protein JTE90_026621 [Oedothorax gibbosus]
MLFAFRQTSRFGTDFSDPLGPTDPCSTAVRLWNPSPASVLKVLTLSISDYHQYYCTVRLHAALRPATCNPRPRRPSYSLRLNLHEGSSAVAGPVIGPTSWSVIHFQCLVCFGS